MPNFIIQGKIMPYVRMTQKTKWYEREQMYLKIKGDIQFQLQAAMREMGVETIHKTPLEVRLSFFVPKGLHTCDIDNQIKAVFDAANKIVWNDDRYIDKVTAIRELGKDYFTHMQVLILI